MNHPPPPLFTVGVGLKVYRPPGPPQTPEPPETPARGRPRIYLTQADRQRAYRQRKSNRANIQHQTTNTG